MADAIKIDVPIVGSFVDRWGDVKGVVGRMEASLPVLESAQKVTRKYDPLFEYLHDGDAWSGFNDGKRWVDVESLSHWLDGGLVEGRVNKRDLMGDPFISIAPTFAPAASYSLVEGDPRHHSALEQGEARARALIEDMAVVDGRVVLRNDGPLLFVTRIQDRRIGNRFLNGERMETWDRRSGTTFSAFDYDVVREVFHNYRVEQTTGFLPTSRPEGWDLERARSRIASRMLKEIGSRLVERLAAHPLSLLGRETVSAIDEFRSGVEGERLIDTVSVMMGNPLHGFDARSMLPGAIGLVRDRVRFMDREASEAAEDLAAFRI